MALKSGRVGIHPSQVDPITGMLLSSPGGTSDLSDLDDVSIDNPELGQLLVYDGEKWENQFASISPVTPSTLASLQDVAISSVSENQILRYNSTASKWENEDMPPIPAAQVNSDWNATSGVAEILNKPTIPAAQVNSDWNATSGVAQILNRPSIPDELTELSDVDITSAADGDYLVYDGTSNKWINSGEAPAPTYTDLTVTMYGAVEDTISFTDAAGISHSEVFASGQSSKSVTLKINPSGSTSIIFTSAAAKDPNNLTADYSKSITITSATTEIKVMPDNTLYWWGYVDNLETMSTANGWSRTGFTFRNPTYNTRDIALPTGSSATNCGVGSTNAVSSTKVNYIIQGATYDVDGYGYIEYATQKANFVTGILYGYVDSSSIKKYELSTGSSGYPIVNVTNSQGNIIYAIWYE